MTASEESTPAATLEIHDRIGVVTLRRPRSLNAINAEMSSCIGRALAAIESDPAVAVAVVTGEGRAFCAGADLKSIAAGRSLNDPEFPEWGFAGLVEHPLRKPLIAAVNGLALGGGAEIVMAADLAVMSSDAVIALPEVRRGLFAAAGGLIRLPRQVPLKVAMAAALTGSPIDAATALRWGLVNEVTPPAETLPTAMSLAAQIAANAPLAVETSKRVVHAAAAAGSEWDRDVWALQAREIDRLLATSDAHEGAVAFAEKRAPVWTGR